MERKVAYCRKEKKDIKVGKEDREGRRERDKGREKCV